MAKRTINDVLEQSRILLQDEVEPYRYKDAQLLDFFNSSLYELKRLRPDAWLGQYNTDLKLYTISDLNTEIPFGSIYFQPVVMYVTGYAELRDDEFAIDGRSATLLTAFARQISAPSAGVLG
jgi:hypothetical protein